MSAAAPGQPARRGGHGGASTLAKYGCCSVRYGLPCRSANSAPCTSACRPTTAFNGPVPTELKIADNWRGPKLFERLENQLAGDYLRDDASVRGIYLLVWRGVHKRWQLPNKKWVNFAGLVGALQDHWASVTGAHPRVEEIKVLGIDLTKRAIAPTPAKKPPVEKVLTKKVSAKKVPAK